MWTNLSGNPGAISVVFRPTLCNVFIFNQHRPIIFFLPSRMFNYSLSLKMFSVKVAMVLRANSTDVAFRVTLDCGNWIGKEKYNRPQQQKDSITNVDRKKIQCDIGQEKLPVEASQKASPDEPTKQFLIDIIQKLFRDWKKSNSPHRS